MPGGLHSSQAVSKINAWLQVARLPVSACSLLPANAWYRSPADLQGVAACLVDLI